MDPDFFDFEVGVPVDEPISAAERVVPSKLPACTVARSFHIGPYEGLSKAWDALTAWIKAEGHEPAANFWQVYLAGPEAGSDSALWRTELNRPLLSWSRPGV
jgi:effector-binding domain-containing protein